MDGSSHESPADARMLDAHMLDAHTRHTEHRLQCNHCMHGSRLEERAGFAIHHGLVRLGGWQRQAVQA